MLVAVTIHHHDQSYRRMDHLHTHMLCHHHHHHRCHHCHHCCSLTFDEFARKWNKPVHEFLLRHIYLEAIDNYKFSKNNATLLTFFFSSCLHEMVVAVVSGRPIFVFFLSQMSQIPLIWIARATALKKRPLLANIFFWVQLVVGMPLITILYTREYFLEHPMVVGSS